MVTQTLKGNEKQFEWAGVRVIGVNWIFNYPSGNIQFDSLLIFLALQYTAAQKSEIVTQLSLCILKIIPGNDCQILCSVCCTY